MSAFWRYFRDTLAWPLIHKPGVLQSLVKGLGQSLDSVREDALYFRKQWFPALCEGKIVPAHGTSRGLTRHPKESAERFRTRVVQAYRWHLLGGRTLGLPEILKFYGFNCLAVETLRDFQPSRWAEFQVRLQAPTSHGALDTLLADLDVLIWLVNEYKAARSLFARLYTSEYDWYPGVWSGGVPEYAWSNFWWSMFSGVRVDDSSLIVSIGYPDRYLVEPYISGEGGALYGMLQRHAFRIPYVDRAFWSWSNWGDFYPVNSAFIVGQILSLLCADYIYDSSAWDGDWDGRVWGIRRIDRYHPDWMMGLHAFAKSELIFSERHADGGVYGDINSNYSTPIVYLLDGKTPIWGDLVWSADKSRVQIRRILEQFKVNGRYQAAQEELLRQAFYARTDSFASNGVYPDHPIWGRFDYSDTFPRLHEFMRSDLSAYLAAEKILSSKSWSDIWDARPWEEVLGYERAQKDFCLYTQSLSKSQLVHAEPHNDGSRFGDINSNYSRPVLVSLPDPQKYSDFKYSDSDASPTVLAIDEQFGASEALQLEGVETDDALVGRIDVLFGLGVYPDHPIWGRFDYSDTFPRLHEFARSDLSAYLAAEKILSSKSWSDIWDERPWEEVLGYERAQKDFCLYTQSLSKSQLVHAEPHDDGSRWGDINSNYSRPVLVSLPDPQKYSDFKYSDSDASPTVLAIDEQFGVETATQMEESVHCDDIRAVRFELQAGRGVYPDHPRWGTFAYSDSFPRLHEFTRQDFSAYFTGYERSQKGFVLCAQNLSKSQLVHAEPHNDGSRFGDINSCYGVPYVRSYPAPPKYSDFVYSEDISEITIDVIEEQFSQTITLAFERHEMGQPASALGRIHGAESEKIHAEGWLEGWDDRYWRGWHGYTNITEAALVEDLHYILHVLASGVTNVPRDLPVSNYPTLHAILHGLMEGVTLVHAFDDTAMQRFFEIAGGCTSIPEDTWES